MTRALGIALVATLGVGAVACGNIARDVIVERAALDGGALDAEAETGAVSSPPPDAGSPENLPPRRRMSGSWPARAGCPAPAARARAQWRRTRKTSMLSRLWRPTIVAVWSLS